jgi:hypothetical protein
MSNNIAVPASIVGDNEQIGTFGQPQYRPGRLNQHLSGTPFSSYHTAAAYLSPNNLPSNYGSVAPSFRHPNLDTISGSLTEGGDFLGTSFTNSHYSAMWRNSAAENYKKQSMKLPEHTPLIQNDTKYAKYTFTNFCDFICETNALFFHRNSFVPVTKVTEIEIPERIGSNFRQSTFNACNALIGN